MERFERDQQPAPLPALEHAHGLARWFSELGPCGHGAMGPVPTGWGEMAQWARLTGTPVQPWQARALRAASAAYVSQLHASAEPDCPAPWQQGPDDDQRDRVARQVRQAFGGRSRPAAG